jgi:hypothetical protein
MVALKSGLGHNCGKVPDVLSQPVRWDKGQSYSGRCDLFCPLLVSFAIPGKRHQHVQIGQTELENQRERRAAQPLTCSRFDVMAEQSVACPLYLCVRAFGYAPLADQRVTSEFGQAFVPDVWGYGNHLD